MKSDKQERKRSSPHFQTLFLPSFSIFNLPFYNFPSFLLQFSPFSTFFLASFFPVGQQKFPGQKSLGGTLSPAPTPPPPPVTPLPKKTILSPDFFNYFHTMYIYIHLSQPYSSKNKQKQKQNKKQTNKQITKNKTKQNKYQNAVPFQNGGQITDFYFASFQFWSKIWKKHFPKGIFQWIVR